MHLRLIFGRPLPETDVQHCLCPVNDKDATEQLIRPKLYIGDALPKEPNGIVTARPEPTTARAKHGDAWCSHGTFLRAALRAATHKDS